MWFSIVHPNRFALYFFSVVAIILLSTYFYGQWILIQIDNNLKEAEVAEQLGTPSTKSDPYDGWKTYRNDEFGFEFRYTDYWFVEEISDNDDVLLSAPDFTRIIFHQGVDDDHHGNYQTSIPVVYSDKPAMRYEYVDDIRGSDYAGVDIVFDNIDFQIYMVPVNAGPSFNSEQLQTMELVLETFKFIEPAN